MHYICLGLGNPGQEYSPTRHNVGFWLADILANKLSLSFKKPFFKPYYIAETAWENNSRLTLVKPTTFMNRSGEVFTANPSFLPGKDTQVIVFVDQMDLPCGALRLKKKGGTAGHNGLKSIFEHIGDDFMPLYIGIGRPQGQDSVIDHVLGQPDQNDKAQIDGAIERAVGGLQLLPNQGFESALSFINQRQSYAGQSE